MNSYQRERVRCRDGVMNDFLSWCRHLLVPFLFHDLTSLHPPSFHRNDFSTCKYEMKGNVGMSHHEKEREQEDACARFFSLSERR